MIALPIAEKERQIREMQALGISARKIGVALHIDRAKVLKVMCGGRLVYRKRGVPPRENRSLDKPARMAYCKCGHKGFHRAGSSECVACEARRASPHGLRDLTPAEVEEVLG